MNKNKSKVTPPAGNLFIIVKSIDGGTGTFLINLLGLKKLRTFKNFNIKTLVLEKPSYRKVANMNFKYLRTKNFYPQKYSFSLKNITNFFAELNWIRHQISGTNYPVCLSIDMRCNLLAIIIKLIFNKKLKVIATNHIDLNRTILDKSTPITNNILKILIKYFYDKADSLVCVSKHLSKNLKRDFGINKKITTIYNGQDFPKFKLRNYPADKNINIISIARLVEQKDHTNLLDAFKLLHQKNKNIKLWICSNGPLKSKLKAYSQKLGLANKVVFTGWVKNINTILNKADIFVLSSKREGFAYVLLEAMAHALPIISTDTPYGPSEVLNKGKYGLLVPMNDPVALNKAVLSLISNKLLYEYYSAKSLKRATDFSLNRMLNGYTKLILNYV
jgi:glycosyltransferase involved in cell wall biosynthesis